MSLNYLRFEVCEAGLFVDGLFELTDSHPSRVFPAGSMLIVRDREVSMSQALPSDMHGAWIVTRSGHRCPKLTVYAWDKRRCVLALRHELQLRYNGTVMIGPRVKKYIRSISESEVIEVRRTASRRSRKSCRAGHYHKKMRSKRAA